MLRWHHRHDTRAIGALGKVDRQLPLPPAHLVRYVGCLAPQSKLRAALSPTPRQQGVDGEATQTGTPSWAWARLLGRVFAVDIGTCLLCRRGALRIIAAITHESVIIRILVISSWRPFHLRSHPPVIAKSYARSTKPAQRTPRGDVRAAAASHRCMPGEPPSPRGQGGETGRVDFLSVNLLPAYRRAIQATEEGQAALVEVIIKPMRTPELLDDGSV